MRKIPSPNRQYVGPIEQLSGHVRRADFPRQRHQNRTEPSCRRPARRGHGQRRQPARPKREEKDAHSRPLRCASFHFHFHFHVRPRAHVYKTTGAGPLPTSLTSGARLSTARPPVVTRHPPRTHYPTRRSTPPPEPSRLYITAPNASPRHHHHRSLKGSSS
jgi:hypothetical protein